VICTKCKKNKDIEKFGWSNKSKGYRHSWCKDCKNKYCKQYYQNNKEQSSKYSKQRRQDNIEIYKERDKQYRMNNPDKINAHTAKRKARKLNQTPIDANMSKINKIYSICTYMNSISINCKWHVDHIKPVSKGGLHHQDNLQILDSISNMKKGSKF